MKLTKDNLEPAWYQIYNEPLEQVWDLMDDREIDNQDAKQVEIDTANRVWWQVHEHVWVHLQDPRIKYPKQSRSIS